jgi:hypothetical protein
MTSLAEVYEGHVGEGASLRRLYAGTALFLGGALMVGLGIVAATTNVPGWFGMNTWQAWEVAGVLAGLGLPAVFVGVFVVLPASDQQRAAAAIGASVAVLGVVFFLYAFPTQWHGDATDRTLQVVAVYSFGALTTFWCLFTAIANFKTRNDPGGTVTLEIKREGGVERVEVTKSDLAEGELGALGSVGSVGVFGGLSDDEPEPTRRRQPQRSQPSAGASANPASDGGATTRDISSPLDDEPASYDDAEVIDRDTPPIQQRTDTYCGNCAHFEYVRTERGMVPYCQRHAEQMDDMEACQQWEPNNYR